ncbi:MAG: hypothetical protein JRD89_21385 [Deltaproteobacteria bacterium]|nr:hypothetical protein [Deltaproteobacteria bacterium]
MIAWEISRLSDRMRLITDHLYLRIWSEIDESGKRIYSNERVREAELHLRLYEDQEYQELRERLQEVEDEHNDLLIELQRLRDRREALAVESGLLSPRSDEER